MPTDSLHKPLSRRLGNLKAGDSIVGMMLILLMWTCPAECICVVCSQLGTVDLRCCWVDTPTDAELQWFPVTSADKRKALAQHSHH